MKYIGRLVLAAVFCYRVVNPLLRLQCNINEYPPTPCSTAVQYQRISPNPLLRQQCCINQQRTTSCSTNCALALSTNSIQHPAPITVLYQPMVSNTLLRQQCFINQWYLTPCSDNSALSTSSIQHPADDDELMLNVLRCQLTY